MAKTKTTPRKSTNMEVYKTRKGINYELQKQARELERMLGDHEKTPRQEPAINQGASCSTTQSTRCDLCNKVFTTPKGLKRHNNYKHSEVTPIYHCNTCFLAFTREDSFKRHYNKSHHTKPTENDLTIYYGGPRDTSIKPKTWTPPAEVLTENDFKKYKNP